MGVILTTYIHWDDPPSGGVLALRVLTKPKVLPYKTTNSDRCNKGGTASAHWPIESNMALGRWGGLVVDVRRAPNKNHAVIISGVRVFLFDRDPYKGLLYIYILFPIYKLGIV